ncbi:MAG: hypothetical protein P857_917 [Candidatus Xenolissoclinum pacificiensis L6]|uniref:Uncharacterized protein n=1 Tax=Candidatus Xenolissoclinum pacificiensis L6 TaxID=1401685 RepID=W2V0I8_9RICK|nr:MAG: hypothetical protein P857_917 [Candidatus Xenolissoclinum pacificiensis L6]
MEFHIIYCTIFHSTREISLHGSSILITNIAQNTFDND